MTSDLDRLLDGSTPAGIYHLPASIAGAVAAASFAYGESPSDLAGQAHPPPEITALADQLSDAGWRVALIPPVDRSRDFYRAVAAQLDLPPWFGGNLDALWDVLSDLREPTALVLLQSSRLAAARPQWWARLTAVLRERTEQGTAFALVLG